MKEDNDQIKLNKGPRKSFGNKTKKFVENSKKAVRDVVATTGIVISTLVPSSVQSISSITLPTAAALVTACCDKIDTTPPTIDAKSTIDISGGEIVRISGNQLYIGNNLVASWHDDMSSTCMISVSMKGNDILGKPLNEAGTINIKATDEAGNSNNASVKVNILNDAPIINAKSEVNIFGGEKINISNNQLSLGDEVIASRSDDKTQNCKVGVKFNGNKVESGDTINGAGTLSIRVEDDENKFDSKDINVTNNTIIGLENLKNLNMQVDEEVDLLKGISLANGVELTKVEIEIDGQRYEIADPHHYTPEYPGTCNIVFTLKGKSGETKEIKSDSLTINAMKYSPITPQEANIYENRDEWKKNVVGDKERYKFYETIGHLQTRKIVEELIKNGSPEYLEKLNNIRIIGLGERPNKDCPYIQGTRELVNSTNFSNGTQHAEILTEKIKTSTSTPGIAQNYPGKIGWFRGNKRTNILEYFKSNPNQKFIFFCANDRVGGVGKEYNPKGTEQGNALEEIINSERCISITSVGNVDALRDYALRWDQPYISRGQYGASGAVGPNVIGAIGGTTESITLNDYNYYPYEHSVTPIGYDQKNLKVSSGGYPAHESETSLGARSNRASSRPAAELAGELRNIAALDPDMSMSDVMNLINSYYISIPATHNGEAIENYNTPDQKEICRQKCLPSTPSQLSSTQPTELPKDSKYPAILWTGKGVEYLDNGQRKPAQNITNPSEIYRLAKNCKFRFNPELFKKQGGKNTAELTARIITSEGNSIPEIQKNISIKIK